MGVQGAVRNSIALLSAIWSENLIRTGNIVVESEERAGEMSLHRLRRPAVDGRDAVDRDR